MVPALTAGDMGDVGKRVERRLKRAIFGWLASVTAKPAADPSAIDLDAVRRVLVVRPNFRMGNLLLVTPALTALRRALPGARIDVLCNRACLPLLTPHPDVDGVIGVDRATFHPRALRALAERLRASGYDLAIDAARGGSFLGAAVAGLSGARHRVASANSRYRAFFDVGVPTRRGSPHKVDLLLDLLAGIGIPPVTRAMRVVLTDAERAAAAALTARLGLAVGRSLVGVNVGARGGKRLPPAEIGAVARRLQRDAAVLCFGGPEDDAALAAVATHLTAETVIAPLLPLRAFAALLGHCAVVVTGDTGPMHLAAAVGTPTVTVTADPRSACYLPPGAQHRVVARRADGVVERVVETVHDLLRGRASSAA
jgi:heptosyltransferase III